MTIRTQTILQAFLSMEFVWDGDWYPNLHAALERPRGPDFAFSMDRSGLTRRISTSSTSKQAIPDNVYNELLRSRSQRGCRLRTFGMSLVVQLQS